MGSRGLSSRTSTTPTIEPSPRDESREAYQKFRGAPINGGWEFKGNEWTEQWFRDNSDSYDLIDSMSREDRDAFQGWTRGDFMRGQQYGKFSDMSSYDQEKTRIYDKYLDQAELKKGIIVYRRASWELINNGSTRALTVEEINARKGELISSKGSMSTAAASSGLNGMGWGKPVEYEIKIPKGKGHGMWVGDSRVNSYWGPKQREFMTNRNGILSIQGARYDDNKQCIVVTLNWEGHEKHDYS